MKNYIIKKYYNEVGKIYYVDSESNNLFDVMREAEKMYTNEVWLIVILEKIGKSIREYNYTLSNYVERLEYRSSWQIVSNARLYEGFENNITRSVHYILKLS